MNPPASCLEIPVANPSAPSGIYEIDPDGPGGSAPFTVTCGMSGGGWTLIYTEDFVSGSSSSQLTRNDPGWWRA